jgi:hypothetical protein
MYLKDSSTMRVARLVSAWFSLFAELRSNTFTSKPSARTHSHRESLGSGRDPNRIDPADLLRRRARQFIEPTEVI